MADLIDFEWPVDRDGYHWVEETAGPTSVLLSRPGGWVLRARGGPKQFYRPLQDEHCSGLFRRFADLDPADKDAILEFTTQFGELDEVGSYLHSIRNRIISFKMMAACLDAELADAHGAAAIFADLFSPQFIMTIDVASLSPVFRPLTLHGALMIQMAQEIAGVAKFRKCKACPTWFPLGKKKATARREFCSDRCRVAWSRQRNRGDAE